jgi:hypothetical protein
MVYKTKIHTRVELLHRIMNAAAYIREHLEMIEPSKAVLWKP